MPAPLYAGHDQPNEPSKSLDAHKGLWFERFFNEYDNQWNVNNENAKKNWIKTVVGSCGNKAQLETNAILQRQLCTDLNGQSRAFKNNWHFITGMGNPHPVENGMSWHPTLGVPYLTGASVKGLIRTWIEQWSGLDDSEIEEKSLKWFGSRSKKPEEQQDDNQAGCFIFFDALPISPVTLHTDIMTPHMGNWYSEGGNISCDVPRDNDGKDAKNSYAKALPADWHKPVIIPFLVVKEATLQFNITPRLQVDISSEELEEVMQILKMSLEYLGTGAKTAVGYGRFGEHTKINKMWDSDKQDLIQKIKDDKKKEVEEVRRSQMTQIERDIEDVINQSNNNPAITLLNSITEGKWESSSDIKLVALKIKELMKADKKWIPDFLGKNRQRLKLKERSIKVQQILKES